ncbi:hypothetical protein SAMN04488009_1123 [Maribacter sedimenticola]|uniref:Uncharacterized protein n=1 Tax=Maribacter sedimenticola TaxID=228956 RepID=A0ABY1SE96_9FLAO|nr:hypothetical protein [Maribacter sedimenticola]SNR30865.1 hypothetical protein SAMN04488009_1123 [Maribacter sedimenticola]
MKRPNSIATLMLCSLLMLSIVSCNQEPKKEKPVPPVVEAPANIISLDEANVIYDNYTKHRVTLIEPYEQQREQDEDFTAGRFVDFDYDTIKQYIAYIDQEAKDAGVNKVTKLRLYFANYPNSDKFPNGKKVIHKRQNSIFMVPTLDKGGINYGFFIGSNGKAELIKDWKDSSTDGIGVHIGQTQKAHAGIMPTFTLNSNLQDSKSLALNFGQGGPPPKTDF